MVTMVQLQDLAHQVQALIIVMVLVVVLVNKQVHLLLLVNSQKLVMVFYIQSQMVQPLLHMLEVEVVVSVAQILQLKLQLEVVVEVVLVQQSVNKQIQQ